MGGMGISWETRCYFKEGLSKHTWLEIYAFSVVRWLAQGSLIMQNTWQYVKYAGCLLAEEWVDGSANLKLALFCNKKWMEKNESPDVISCFIAGPGFWPRCTKCGWYSIGGAFMYLSPIQYFITFGVNRLNRDGGWRVLTIHRSSYSKRPALLSDIKYWFGEIDLNSSHIKRAWRENQSSR